MSCEQSFRPSYNPSYNARTRGMVLVISSCAIEHSPKYGNECIGAESLDFGIISTQDLDENYTEKSSG